MIITATNDANKFLTCNTMSFINHSYYRRYCTLCNKTKFLYMGGRREREEWDMQFFSHLFFRCLPLGLKSRRGLLVSLGLPSRWRDWFVWILIILDCLWLIHSSRLFMMMTFKSRQKATSRICQNCRKLRNANLTKNVCSAQPGH